MHGRPRRSVAIDPARQKDEEAKIANLQSLLAEVLRNHRDRSYSKRALQQNARLLELNPEVYTAWNYRKLAVKHMLDSEPNEEARKNILEEELRVVERALKRNYKSYCAWHHRKWVIRFGLSSLDIEFQLLDKFLAADPRNFHGWAYRRFAGSIKKVNEESELQYTIKKINENFSNYSAWHNRSVLLSKQFKDKNIGKHRQHEILTDEYELVKQAFFTEPEDQSGWFYLMWLLSQTIIPSGPSLTGFWPSNESLVIIDFDSPSKLCSWSFKNTLSKSVKFHNSSLCMVICFSEPVLGVDSTTVQISTSLNLSGAICGAFWSPLLDCTEGSMIWTADLLAFCNQFRDVDLCTIHIEVGAAPGISSKYGAFSGVNQVSFDLQLRTTPGDTYHKEDIMDSFITWPVQRTVYTSNVEQVMEDTTRGLLVETNHMPETSAVALLEAQIKSCRELLELENDSKWAKLTLARLLMAHDNVANFVHKQYTDEVRQLFKDLMTTDPTHQLYYDESLSLLSMDQISSNVHELHGRWWDLKESEGDDTHGWFRLDHMSLSKLGFTDRLIWVQRLDLSHNQLKSLEGLEPMQLLVCLNVAHNLLSTATALGPIRLLKNLEALNVQHNKIGGQTVDSHRYLFQSALNNSIATAVTGYECSPLVTVHLWELFSVFRGLKLIQLEIFGNAIANDDMCKSHIIQALPCLLWLDQVRVCR